MCSWGGGVALFQQLFQCKMGTVNDKNKLKTTFGLILVVRNGENIITLRPHPQQTYYEQLAVYCRLHWIESFVKINTYFAVLILDAINAPRSVLRQPLPPPITTVQGSA